MNEEVKTQSPYLPCGHSAEQAAWLGCTEAECRPDDARISAEYFAERAMRRGMAQRGRPS